MCIYWKYICQLNTDRPGGLEKPKLLGNKRGYGKRINKKRKKEMSDRFREMSKVLTSKFKK